MDNELTWRPQFHRAARFIQFWDFAAASAIGGLLLLFLVPAVGQMLLGASTIYFVARLVVLRRFPHPYLPKGGVIGQQAAIRPVSAKTLRSYVSLYDAEHQQINHWTAELTDYHAKLVAFPFLWPRALASHAVITPANPSKRHQVLGSLSIVPSTIPEVRVAVGAFMAPEHRGQGLFTEALALGFDAVDELPIMSVHLMCDLDNLAMMRSANKAGMIRIDDMDYQHPDQTTGRAAVFIRGRCEEPIESSQPLTWERD